MKAKDCYIFTRGRAGAGLFFYRFASYRSENINAGRWGIPRPTQMVGAKLIWWDGRGREMPHRVVPGRDILEGKEQLFDFIFSNQLLKMLVEG